MRFLPQPEVKASTWRTVHYYKLQHAFFAKYHNTQPVYASWGEEKNPDILKEPGSSSNPRNTAKEFAARGAEKRARRRMGAIERGGAATSTAASPMLEVGFTPCQTLC